MGEPEEPDTTTVDDGAVVFSVGAHVERGDRTELAVAGEVDTYTSSQLRESLDEALDAGVRHLVLDVSAMEFIDSTGIGVLVGALKKLRARNGTLTLRGSRPATLEVLSIVGLTSHFILEAAAVQGEG